MGRGAYDLTDPYAKKSAAADTVILWEEIYRKEREEAAAKLAAEDAEMKLIKSKKSRGIMAARREAAAEK